MNEKKQFWLLSTGFFHEKIISQFRGSSKWWYVSEPPYTAWYN